MFQDLLVYDDPKCCLCKEFCTKNSSCNDRFECFQYWVDFSEEKIPNFNSTSGCYCIPFCDKCTSVVTYNGNTDGPYLFIRSYKYGKCILKPDCHFRMND
jgi:hypothetical protein